MRIGIDCSPVLYRKTGVGNYVHNLLLNLAKIDTKNSYVLFSQSLRHLESGKIVRYDFAHKKTVAVRVPKPLLDFCWYKLRFPSIKLLTGKVDIFHGNFYLPLVRNGKGIITIHDMSFIACIIAVSQFTKAEILRYISVPEGKIDVIYEGVNMVKQGPSVQSDDILKKRGVTKDYILFVGTIEPRKNLEKLVRAFKLLIESRGDKYELVIVGKLGWKYDAFLQSLKTLGIQDKIKFLGYVPDTDLPIIYKHASVFVYPSVYEGFGLPVLEAMAYGTPVITSNVSSLPEVAGDAALLVNPYDEGQIAEGMDKVLSDPELRRQLIRRGREQVKKFSWMETASRTLELYEQVHNEK